MQDALGVWTRITFDAALQDTLDGLDNNQLTIDNDFELEHEEWNGTINSMMMNVYSACWWKCFRQPLFNWEHRFGTNQELSTRTSMITSLMS